MVHDLSLNREKSPYVFVFVCLFLLVSSFFVSYYFRSVHVSVVVVLSLLLKKKKKLPPKRNREME